MSKEYTKCKRNKKRTPPAPASVQQFIYMLPKEKRLSQFPAE